ncbi:MAG: hypothetical protein LBT21_05685, partial [Oscillospiraceae bacterium]|jgi:hypothetical protein|nr:hypothetical protein [Oscillospiraceae bacterium]
MTLFMLYDKFTLLFGNWCHVIAPLLLIVYHKDYYLSSCYNTNVDSGCGLIKVGAALVPFNDKFPRDTKLYRYMSTTANEKFEE